VSGVPARPRRPAGISHRYVAFLRGVTPQNAGMADLKRCFESAGFGEVRTVLASGNVVFSSGLTSSAEIQNLAEHAMAIGMGRTFGTLVRSVQSLQTLLDADPFAAFSVPQEAKRVVTFLRDAKPSCAAPIGSGTRPADRARWRADPQAAWQRRADGVCAAPKGTGFHGHAGKGLRQGHHDPHPRYRQEMPGNRVSAQAPQSPATGPIAALAIWRQHSAERTL
jgi:hypothetical protein